MFTKQHIVTSLVLCLVSIVTVLALSWLYVQQQANQLPTASHQLAKESPNTVPAQIMPSPSPSPSPIPVSKKLTGGTHVFQTFNNCGPAALSMAFSYLDENISQQQLGNQLRPYQVASGDNDDKSVTLRELAWQAEQLGYHAYHRPAGSIELLQQIVAIDLPVITRTWLEPNEDIGHYRVVTGYDQATQTLMQDDSLQGNDLSYSYQEFNQLWQAFNYEFLVIATAEQQPQVETILGNLVDSECAWKSALQQAEAQLKDKPDDIYAQFNALVAEYHLGEFEAATQRYAQIDNQLPSRMLWYQIEPILAYYQLGNYDSVFELTNQIIDNNNRAFSELHWLQANIFKQQGQVKQARSAKAQAELYNTGQSWQQNLESVTMH